MAFFTSAVDVLQTLVIALGAGLAIWGVVNLLESKVLKKHHFNKNACNAYIIRLFAAFYKGVICNS